MILLVGFTTHRDGLTTACDVERGTIALWRAARDEQDLTASGRTVDMTVAEAIVAVDLLTDAIARYNRERG